uniref:Uncharacterized protein n=1 Tax=Eutreptiella gymnastica TaxID=73025 RepID=A0A7S1N514_9EUGL|mmetsp:Transcript_119924/g.208797  ORF Transcript_119924/g.208797 Transcript_119924/m.208797 type:complete len:114 (+) Transcript_119924:214-555(+)
MYHPRTNTMAYIAEKQFLDLQIHQSAYAVQSQQKNQLWAQLCAQAQALCWYDVVKEFFKYVWYIYWFLSFELALQNDLICLLFPRPTAMLDPSPKHGWLHFSSIKGPFSSHCP